MRRLRIEICSVDGQIVAASCVESIAPLKGMWQVWRHGAVPVSELSASVNLMLASIPSHRKEIPTTKINRKGKRHG